MTSGSASARLIKECALSRRSRDAPLGALPNARMAPTRWLRSVVGGRPMTEEPHTATAVGPAR
eukprot:1676470-Lingulodinium_polyedra.AAC.1